MQVLVGIWACAGRETEMKEVFTKSFWKSVKKTFDEARDGPSAENTIQIPDGEPSLTTELPAIRRVGPASTKPPGREP